jgi:hypothetical protein
MEFLLELLFEMFFEFGIQLIIESLLELGLHSIAEPLRRPTNPWSAAAGFALLGAIAGGLSLLLFPAHMVSNVVWRWVNLLATPLAVGLCMGWLGGWRSRRGQVVLRIDRFSYGYLFALSLAFVRFQWAR